MCISFSHTWFRGYMHIQLCVYGLHAAQPLRFVWFVFNFKAHICLFADRNIISCRCNVKRSATKRCQVKQRAQTMQNKSICAWRKGKYNFPHKRESFVGHWEIRNGMAELSPISPAFTLKCENVLFNFGVFLRLLLLLICLCSCSYVWCRSIHRWRDENEFGVIVWNLLLNMLAFIPWLPFTQAPCLVSMWGSECWKKWKKSGTTCCLSDEIRS